MLSVNHPIGAGEGPGGPACGPSGPFARAREAGTELVYAAAGAGLLLVGRRRSRTRLVAHTGPVAHAVMHYSAARSSLSRTTESPGHGVVTRTAVTSYSGHDVTVSAGSEVRLFTPLDGKWKEQKTWPAV